jgi:hypothetical protein
VVHLLEIAQNGLTMGPKWAKNGHSVENVFVSEESRVFFQPVHPFFMKVQVLSILNM